MNIEQNPRDRVLEPNADTAEVRDREDGSVPVDETEDSIRDPDQRASDAIAGEAAAAPDGAADDRRVVDHPGDTSAAVDRTVPGDQPSDDVPASDNTPEAEDAAALLPRAETYRLRIRWREVQLGFVDDPRQAVDDAAELVSAAADRVASLLRDQVGALDEARPSVDADGDAPNTERLRTLLRHYHALLDRMLAV